jgi:sigma-B regulation protein RsbU (phosphoserine phosphatase)
MDSDKSMTNESFGFLAGSGSFLNIIINSITSCILLLDNEMRLRAFNNPFKTIFSNKKNEDLLYKKCGEAIGCAHQIEEQKECGETTKCCHCELRISAMDSYLNNVVIYKDNIIRPFFNNENLKVDKHLQFSTRLFKFNDEKYIIMMVEDVSKYY